MSVGGDPKSKEKLEELVQELYKADCWIDFGILRELLAYGEHAIPYLGNIIRSALDQRDEIDFKNPPKHSDWFTVVHALYLLAELRAEDSLDLVLEFLSQKEDFLDYWLHDLLNDDIWEVVYYLGMNNLDRLEEFVLNQKINVFSRLTVCTALIQIAAHQHKKRNQVIRIFKEVLGLEKEDPDFIGLLASELLDIKDDDLRTGIIQALEHHEVWPGIISKEEVEWSYKNKKVRTLKPLDIFQRYEFFREYAYFAQTSPFKPPQHKKQKKTEKHS